MKGWFSLILQYILCCRRKASISEDPFTFFLQLCSYIIQQKGYARVFVFISQTEQAQDSVVLIYLVLFPFPV